MKQEDLFRYSIWEKVSKKVRSKLSAVKKQGREFQSEQAYTSKGYEMEMALVQPGKPQKPVWLKWNKPKGNQVIEVGSDQMTLMQREVWNSFRVLGWEE